MDVCVCVRREQIGREGDARTHAHRKREEPMHKKTSGCGAAHDQQERNKPTIPTAPPHEKYNRKTTMKEDVCVFGGEQGGAKNS